MNQPAVNATIVYYTPPTIEVGDTFPVRVLVKANSGTEAFVGVDFPFAWNQDVLAMTGARCHLPNLWAGFYPDSVLDGFNTTHDDGTAYYSIWGQPGVPYVAIEEGLPIFDVTFVAKAEGVSEFEPILTGTYAKPLVADEEVGGFNIAVAAPGSQISVVAATGEDLKALIDDLERELWLCRHQPWIPERAQEVFALKRRVAKVLV